MSGFAPPVDEVREDATELAPVHGEVDWDDGIAAFLSRASTKGRLGIRIGVLLVVTAPLWVWGRLKSGASLPPEERARLLDALLSHRVFFVRELCLLLKLVACMALFRARGMRERSSYDPPERARSGQRALQVIREVA